MSLSESELSYSEAIIKMQEIAWDQPVDFSSVRAILQNDKASLSYWETKGYSFEYALNGKIVVLRTNPTHEMDSQLVIEDGITIYFTQTEAESELLNRLHSEGQLPTQWDAFELFEIAMPVCKTRVTTEAIEAGILFPSQDLSMDDLAQLTTPFMVVIGKPIK